MPHHDKKSYAKNQIDAVQANATRRTISKSQLDKLPVAVREAWDQLDEETKMRLEGFGGTEKYEPVPQYITTPCEKVFSGNNNTWIVLGRDRPGSAGSGRGGSGDTGAGSIDLCVGRAGAQAREAGPDGEPLFVDNDFKSDSARIYISQKTEIDKNFGLVPGFQGNAQPRSGIGVKADLVRIVARENIKLVTRTDDSNSQGGHIGVVGGIDLIAGNDDSKLQPLVLGKNMREFMFYVLKDLSNVAQAVHDLALTQQAFDTAIAAHTHVLAPQVDPITGLPTTSQSPTLAAGVAIKSLKHLISDYPSHIAMTINNILLRFKYITPGIGSYICSDRNNTN